MAQRGIWTSPFDFRPIDRGPGTLFEEIATRDRSPDFFSLAMSLPDPDPVLRKLGKDIKVYRELLSDSRVGPCVESRKAAVVSLEWSVARGKAPAAVAKFVGKCLGRLKVGQIVREVLNAPLFGMQPLEVVWRRDGGSTVPDRVTGKPVEWFTFASEDNSLRLRTKNNLIQGEELPPKKFLLPRYNATYDNPYGERVLSRCFWPVTFKKGGLKFWTRFAEKFGSAWVIGRYPSGASQEVRDELAVLASPLFGFEVGFDQVGLEGRLAQRRRREGWFRRRCGKGCRWDGRGGCGGSGGRLAALDDPQGGAGNLSGQGDADRLGEGGDEIAALFAALNDLLAEPPTLLGRPAANRALLNMEYFRDFFSCNRVIHDRSTRFKVPAPPDRLPVTDLPQPQTAQEARKCLTSLKNSPFIFRWSLFYFQSTFYTARKAFQKLTPWTKQEPKLIL